MVKLFKNKTKKWIHLFINNEEIICTPSHPFFILNKGWVIANKLFENDIVVLYNDNIVKIQSIYVETLNTEEFTYNFEVEDYHTYYVSSCNVLVHNTCTKVTNEKGKVLYRGGDDLLENEDDFKNLGDIVKPKSGGPSLSTDIKFAIRVSEGRGAYTLDKIPKGLKIRQNGNRCHYVIEVINPMPKTEYIALLKTIKLTPA